MDGAHLADTLLGLDAKRTLLVVSSKTFTTMETLTNAVAARQWLSAALGEDDARLHIVAVTAEREGRRTLACRKCFRIGNGWGDGIPYGGLSACRSPWRLARLILNNFSPAHAPWMNILSPHRRRKFAADARISRRLASQYLRLSNARRLAL